MKPARALHLLGLMALVLTFPFAAFAQENTAVIKYRQDVMRSQGAHSAAIKEIITSKLPYGDQIAAHAKSLADTANMIAEIFPEGTDKGKTDAMPAIWNDMAKFKAGAEALNKAATKLVQVVSSGDMKAIDTQYKAVGKACGDCHKSFRKDKKDSYKEMK
ncbi:MAG: cytochrome c [Candidatus Lambdaproteobacteria bacterium]|nr:cytochrome c [Candidatus Lambdaproteobacteria bacterium]